MSFQSQCTLQISLAPSDYKHAKHLLPHQISLLGTQVDEILLTVDTRRSKGRFGESWDENAENLNNMLLNLKRKYAHIRVENVSYDEGTRNNISRFFFKEGIIPDKDFRGGPFYAYFFGLYKASNPYVFHLDSDMFLGGRNDKWIKEALELYEKTKNLFIVSPLPGPPHPNEELIDQNIIEKLGSYSFQLQGMSTRVFLIKKDFFINNKLSLQKPSLRNQIKAVVEGNSNADLPENIILSFMHEHKMKRIDFLGTDTGLYTLHPPFRTDDFYAKIPDLLQRIESGNLPFPQLGFYDIVDELVDWSSAREKLKHNRWWKRMLKA